ncbi:MAG: DUF4011 domain-containing protein, partial [Lachnospiraceae bacterium]|nr:DUF4011 domain-containing protein [Lachnospiraceae bacterium]
MDSMQEARVSSEKVISGEGNSGAPVSPDRAEIKLKQWETKLLDLGLRNPLISMRFSKTMIPLLCNELGDLEDALSDGTEYSVQELPEGYKFDSDEPDFETIWELGEASEPLKEAFSKKKIHSIFSEKELNSRLKNLFRAAKSSMEENGANTLYLALGLLRWYETEKSENARYAPIILLPVEMVRKFGLQGYKIRLRDEDPILNVTIFEKLKQDFQIEVKGLDPIPLDEHGVDLDLIFSTISKTTAHKKEWGILNAACLGIFSFSQFVMWNDLKNRSEDLAKNKIVRSLMDGKLAWQAEDLVIGDRVSEDQVYLPLPADASQLFAIEAAAEGESFVLHGPPGTGKSQTITALIANALSRGKTVLFVAEKMAALEVVERRLDKIGIGAFCLELHSNKAKKKAVLEQLRVVSELTKKEEPEVYARRAAQAKELRKELQEYADELHIKRPCGLSLYQMVGQYEESDSLLNSLREGDPALKAECGPMAEGFAGSAQGGIESGILPGDSFLKIQVPSPESFDKIERESERLVAAGRNVGHPANHPLGRVGAIDYDRAMQEQLPGQIYAYKEALNHLKDVAPTFAAVLGMDGSISKQSLQRMKECAEWLLKWGALPGTWAKKEDIVSFLRDIKELSSHGVKASESRGFLMPNWNEEFLAQDGDALLQQYNEASSKWFFFSTLAINKLAKSVRIFRVSPENKDTMGEDFLALSTYGRESRIVENGLSSYRGDLGVLYRGQDTDWDRIMALAEEAEAISAGMDKAWGSSGLRVTCAGDDGVRKMAEAFYEGLKKVSMAMSGIYQALSVKESFAANGAGMSQDGISQYGAGMPQDGTSQRGAGMSRDGAPQNGFSASTGAVFRESSGTAQDWIQEEELLCQNLSDHLGELKDWITWNKVSSEAEKDGLLALTDAYRAGMPHSLMNAAFHRALYRALAIQTIDGSETLKNFSGAMFDEKVAAFKKLDSELMTLSQQEIFWCLASRLPNFAREASKNSEVGILQKAIRSGGRALSIRNLFEKIPTLLPRLCPCMLMSPLSAAQYLDPKREPFDIVVFDEASQLQTGKAVGALARGRDAVIVGDPKQMPPTTFFAANAVDEENLEIEDLESILDDCLALQMPDTHLLWHYRSRHESLIAFSNQQFYENKLFTFPSVNDRESRVQFIPVEGVFDRGKTRQNRAEAQAVVEELKRRAKDDSLSKFSVGVVTFNISQQNLIDDLLSEACARDKELDDWVYHVSEPVFIKNLESVQGDERDVILFSVGYGKDKEGKTFMNFGPLNRGGGWRRLNVAVSRARCEMMIFSSLMPQDIKISQGTSEGVVALRRFLEFAKESTEAARVRGIENSGEEAAAVAGGENESAGTELFEDVEVVPSGDESAKAGAESFEAVEAVASGDESVTAGTESFEAAEAVASGNEAVTAGTESFESAEAVASGDEATTAGTESFEAVGPVASGIAVVKAGPTGDESVTAGTEPFEAVEAVTAGTESFEAVGAVASGDVEGAQAELNRYQHNSGVMLTNNQSKAALHISEQGMVTGQTGAEMTAGVDLTAGVASEITTDDDQAEISAGMMTDAASESSAGDSAGMAAEAVDSAFNERDKRGIAGKICRFLKAKG